MIITSFAKGDKKALEPLVNKEMFKNFSEEIDQRKKNQLKSELTFVGVKSAEIKNFENLQELMEKIRETLTTSEPISTMKAYFSIVDNIPDWNILMPPLAKIENPSNHKIVTRLRELVCEIDKLIPSS